ncbi:putative glucose-6-phosphate 1-epimerase [Impatiens glandulifera]|uniref:putative glucose-6-phosphate 1-epimerase n=1 Tax=Impatiens glandulifera TaxID=253017 RepID=UPI001FB0DF0D|nr:putative glucose-6-phosphate 1-epimerase [Impatiens glandulifera]
MMMMMKQTPLKVFDYSDRFHRISLSEPGGSSAVVLLQNGRLISWKNNHGEELLSVSGGKAISKSPESLRGGISIRFRQFGNSETPLSPRKIFWSLDEDCDSPLRLLVPNSNQSSSSVNLIFKATKEDKKMWPSSFEMRLSISLDLGKLTLVPCVKNTDSKPFAFTFSLCNSLCVSDISEVRVEGLETLDYLDNLDQRKRFTEQADAITFDGEVDRVYLNTNEDIAIIDHKKKKTLVVRKEGLPDVVIWNPWNKNGKAVSFEGQLGGMDYMTMLSVCSGVIEKPMILKPSEEWKARHEIRVVSSSYCSGHLDSQMVLREGGLTNSPF